MNTNQRNSLSSSMMSGRIKKFDTYRHNPRTSKREIVGNGIKPGLKSTNVQSSAIPARPAKQQTTTNSRPTSNISKGLTGSQALALEAVTQSPASNKSIIADQFNSVIVEQNIKRKRTKLQTVTYMMAAVVFLFATTVSAQTYLTNQKAQEQIGVLGDNSSTDSQGVVEGNGNNPAESPIPDSAIYSYNVSPEQPRYLRIPSLDVFARIKHTGIDNRGAVDAPWNIHDVSWYNESAEPGSTIGSSLLLGHVSGWTGPGVFKRVNELQPGQQFEIEKGSGEKLTYEVTRSEEIPLDQVNMGKILSADDPRGHDLKLMTCSGSYNHDTETFEKRFVVYAKIIR